MTSIAVIKVGGSLLATPGAMRRVNDWLRSESDRYSRRLLIAGGGPAVDGLRAIDAANPVSTESAHLAAIRMMDANTRLLPEWIPGVRLIDLAERASEPPAGVAAALVLRWLLEVEPHLHGERLRAAWETTSDSIAARVAGCLNAELILLKHSLETTYDSIQELHDAGFVDAELPRLTTNQRPLRVVGLMAGPSDPIQF